jgi:hypothetical protein
VSEIDRALTLSGAHWQCEVLATRHSTPIAGAREVSRGVIEAPRLVEAGALDDSSRELNALEAEDALDLPVQRPEDRIEARGGCQPACHHQSSIIYVFEILTNMSPTTPGSSSILRIFL